MLNVQPRLESSKLMMWLSPFIAVTLTLAVSSVLFVWLDVSPLKAFQVFVMMPFSDSYNLGELLVKSAPLMLCAVGLALCYRANIWNIGAEGQLLIGAVAASAVAVNADDTSGIGMLLATLIAGMAAGAGWAAIPTWLNRRFHTNIILTTIMLNYIGLYVLLWAVHGPLRDPQGFGFPESQMFADAALLHPLFDSGRASASIIVAVVIAMFSGVVLFKTLPGFQLRVLGSERAAAKYAGFSEHRLVWGVMLFAGLCRGCRSRGPDWSTGALCFAGLWLRSHYRGVFGASESDQCHCCVAVYGRALYGKRSGTNRTRAANRGDRAVPRHAAVFPTGV